MRYLVALAVVCVTPLISTYGEIEPQEALRVTLSWGHRSSSTVHFSLKLLPDGVTVSDVAGDGLESDDAFREGFWETHAGGGDVDSLDFIVHYPKIPVKEVGNLHPIWNALLSESDSDTSRRLRSDPAYRRDPRRLTVRMNREGTRGFSVTVDQLLQNGAFWVPSLDLYMASGNPPVSFEDHQEQLLPFKGKRILQEIQDSPEATYEQYSVRWEDMGNPAYVHSFQPHPGHIVCLTWDSAIHKFGIDRAAGAWNDYGNPDRFRFWFGFAELGAALRQTWKGQRLAEGLPIITTVIEKDGVRYEIEQFAFPLNGPPAERRGDIPMVLLQKIKVTNLSGSERFVPILLNHARNLAPDAEVQAIRRAKEHTIRDSAGKQIFFSLEEETGPVTCSKPANGPDKMARVNVSISLELPANESKEFVVKLPSPVLSDSEQAALSELDYATARGAAVKFWSDYEKQGARFYVPEKAVNELFRANLWHALRLPRRHGGSEPSVRIDLPYSNFAYSQTGIPWPVNQSIYVDTMIYDLRGYHAIAAEELAAILRGNLEDNGHIKGYANWLVYTPSTLYAVAKNYLLSQDREAFERLLPASLKAMNWCLGRVRDARDDSGPGRGLVTGPLNDGTGDGRWAFNQAYMFAGLDLFADALQRFGHPRAEECRAAARELRKSIDLAYREAAARSPLVQLRDHTWMPYVPCEATRFGRLFDQWYPTDVDTGALHLLRLKAIDSDSDIAESLLNDHEDNLFLHGWGMANEPVYNPHATAYLLRDDPKAVVRTFYSMMACAFSHSVYEPVEHRWAHGQYFGPPSTDGAWAELYRNMLIQELDDGTLFLFAATPRKWLEEGKQIMIERAPTYYGKLSAQITSGVHEKRILAEIAMPDAARPKALLIRFRHPQGDAIRSVTVNGEAWQAFDAEKEWVRIEQPVADHYSLVVEY
jgi:hypothetical protein